MITDGFGVDGYRANPYRLVRKANMREFVRTQIGSPIIDTGNSGQGVVGSRSSDYVNWHAYLNLKDRGDGKWMFDPNSPPDVGEKFFDLKTHEPK